MAKPKPKPKPRLKASAAAAAARAAEEDSDSEDDGNIVNLRWVGETFPRLLWLACVGVSASEAVQPLDGDPTPQVESSKGGVVSCERREAAFQITRPDSLWANRMALLQLLGLFDTVAHTVAIRLAAAPPRVPGSPPGRVGTSNSIIPHEGETLRVHSFSAHLLSGGGGGGEWQAQAQRSRRVLHRASCPIARGGDTGRAPSAGQRRVQSRALPRRQQPLLAVRASRSIVSNSNRPSVFSLVLCVQGSSVKFVMWAAGGSTTPE